MAGFLFLCIGITQLIINRVQSQSGGSKINQFVDLCTLANMSILLFDEHMHGYYIHAQAPWGTSDIPLDWLQKELHAEANGQHPRGRGL